MGEKTGFNAQTMGVKEAYVAYTQADKIATEQTRIKKAIRESYLDMVLNNRGVLVAGKDEKGLDFGFEVKVTSSFKKTTFERKCLERFGKELTNEIMSVYDESKDGESRNFGTF